MVRTVGIIGGGQLAWMMAAAASKLDVELVVQTPSPTDPAVSIATHTIFAPIADASATAKLARLCEVITFENEFIDLEALQQLEQQGVCFYPRLHSIAPLLDKFHQRSYLRDRGLPTPQFVALEANSDLTQLGFPVVLKSRRLGYDGQGTFIIKDQPHLQQVLAQCHVGCIGESSLEPNRWLLEEFVPFERELAVMAARSQSGEMAVYPVVETQQENQVCRRVIVTRDLDASVVEQVQTIAHKLLASLEFVGIMGIEFFLSRTGQVLVNETAPRTHNSGHYSLDACVTSQFEQQLRAVCQLPLGDPSLQGSGAVMVNLLGYETAESDYADKRQQLAQLPNAHVYWYGKSIARPGRKLGHVTVLLSEGQGRAAALHQAETIESIWYG
jgi:5-(carboxyamino)imidazole ribonucleotide synthase